MSIFVGNLKVTVTEHVSYTGNDLRVEAWRMDVRTGKSRTWSSRRSEEDFTRLGLALRGVLGPDNVPAPPLPSSSPAVLEGYLGRLLQVPGAVNAVYEFLEEKEPVLQGEVGTCAWDGRAGGLMALVHMGVTLVLVARVESWPA